MRKGERHLRTTAAGQRESVQLMEEACSLRASAPEGPGRERSFDAATHSWILVPESTGTPWITDGVENDRAPEPASMSSSRAGADVAMHPEATHPSGVGEATGLVESILGPASRLSPDEALAAPAPASSPVLPSSPDPAKEPFGGSAEVLGQVSEMLLAMSDVVTANAGRSPSPISDAPAKPVLVARDDDALAKPLLWERPHLALVAVLIASHAAALLIGVAIGRSYTSPPAVENASQFNRRFSSGPSGMHARLCMP